MSNNQVKQLIAYLSGVQGAVQPKFSTVAELLAASHEVSLKLQGLTLSHARTVFAIGLTIYGASNGDTNAGDVVNEMQHKHGITFHPEPAVAKVIKSDVKLTLQTLGERFKPSDRFNQAALIAEALAFAQGVNIQAERKKRAAERKAKLEAEAQEAEAQEAEAQEAKAKSLPKIIGRMGEDLELIIAAYANGDAMAKAALELLQERLQAALHPKAEAEAESQEALEAA